MAESSSINCIRANWPVPEHVHALTTTRQNGFSSAGYEGLNLASHVGDQNQCVERNRGWVMEHFRLPAQPVWLQQIHGDTVIRADAFMNTVVPPEADAAWTSSPGVVCAVLTADCLPVFFTSRQGDCVAIAHAGWRGLLNGIISRSFHATGISVEDCLVWLGPAIGTQAFEVGIEVYQAFIGKNAENNIAFTQTDEQHWLCDIYQLARIELQQLGVSAIYGGDLCTYTEEEHFYSFRRDGAQTGRMASLIWLAE